MHPGCNIGTEGRDGDEVTDIDDVCGSWRRGTRAVMRFGNFILLTLDVRNLRKENPKLHVSCCCS